MSKDIENLKQVKKKKEEYLDKLEDALTSLLNKIKDGGNDVENADDLKCISENYFYFINYKRKEKFLEEKSEEEGKDIVVS